MSGSPHHHGCVYHHFAWAEHLSQRLKIPLEVMSCDTVCRYLISQHPEVDAKLAAELDEAGLLVTPQRPAPRAMEYADLARLTYLGWVCKVGAIRTTLPNCSQGSRCWIKSF